MAPKRFLLLVNEKARSGRRAIATARHLLSEGSYDLMAAHAPHLPSVATYERVLVFGGDGSVRHLVPYLRHATCVGLVPAGTGNNLSKTLGIPQRLSQAILLALRGKRIRRIDVLEVNGTEGTCYVTTQAALGFAAVVALRYDRLRGIPAGRVFSYPWGGGIYRLLSLYELFLGPRPAYRVTVSFPDASIAWDAAAVFLGNQAGIGGTFFPCPGAEPDDKLLHVCLIARPKTRLKSFALLREVARGGHATSVPTQASESTLEISTSHPDHVRLLRSPGPVRLTFHADPPASGLLADGDLFRVRGDLIFTVLPGALPVVVA